MTSEHPDLPAPRDPVGDLQVRAAVHDANQLLWVIQGQASLLRRAQGDDAVAAMAERIAAAARDAAALLRPLLGPVEVDDDDDEPESDIAQVLWSSWTRCVEGANARGLTKGGWQLDAPSPPGPRVAVPERLAARILVNLFANAIDAMSRGGRVTCRLETTGDEIAVELRDDGPGLPAAVAAAPFAERQVSDKAGGHGLGLAGCRRLARDHGGELEVVAAADPGAVFRLRLPAAPRGLRVLAVDDEATVREMLAAVLGAEGHAVQLAAGPEEARRVCADGRFDAVLLDYRLLGYSGLDLAIELRRQDRSVAIILMTGWGPADEMASAPTATVDYRATKPLDMPTLLRLVRRAGALTVQRRGAQP